MKKLKIVAPEWVNYTGSLGMVHFTNGLSDQFIADHIRRRLSIGMAMVEIDADGNEEPASPTHKMITAAAIRADVSEPLNRQSDSDKAHELLGAALDVDANTPIHTKGQLEKIADKEGIKGLRDIADRWHVKSRSIPDLINAILDAQERFVVNQRKHHVERISEELANNEALKQAALTGDLTTAINTTISQENNLNEPDITADTSVTSNSNKEQIDLEDYLLNLPDSEADIKMDKHP